MSDFNWLASAGNTALLVAFYFIGERAGRRQVRTNVIRHGFQFADDDREKAGRVSPTLLRFLRSLENKEHRH